MNHQVQIKESPKELGTSMTLGSQKRQSSGFAVQKVISCLIHHFIVNKKVKKC